MSKSQGRRPPRHCRNFRTQNFQLQKGKGQELDQKLPITDWIQSLVLFWDPESWRIWWFFIIFFFLLKNKGVKGLFLEENFSYWASQKHSTYKWTRNKINMWLICWIIFKERHNCGNTCKISQACSDLFTIALKHRWKTSYRPETGNILRKKNRNLHFFHYSKCFS